MFPAWRYNYQFMFRDIFSCEGLVVTLKRLSFHWLLKKLGMHDSVQTYLMDFYAHQLRNPFWDSTADSTFTKAVESFVTAIDSQQGKRKTDLRSHKNAFPLFRHLLTIFFITWVQSITIIPFSTIARIFQFPNIRRSMFWCFKFWIQGVCSIERLAICAFKSWNYELNFVMYFSVFSLRVKFDPTTPRFILRGFGIHGLVGTISTSKNVWRRAGRYC